VDAHFDLGANEPPLPTITWRIDDGAWQEAEVAPRARLAEGLSDGPHTLWLMVRGLDEHQRRWIKPPVASVTFLGLDLLDGGQLLPVPEDWKHPRLKIEFLGDSITEGVLIQSPRPGKETRPWQSDALHSFACRTAMLLGASWRQVGFGATGLARAGSGGAPPALESFDFFYEGCPRDDWHPDLVVINQGANDAAMPPESYAPLYSKYLALIRRAYPRAKIAAVPPFGGFHAEPIRQTVEAHRAAGDKELF